MGKTNKGVGEKRGNPFKDEAPTGKDRSTIKKREEENIGSRAGIERGLRQNQFHTPSVRKEAPSS